MKSIKLFWKKFMELRNDKTRVYFSRGKMKNPKSSLIPIGFKFPGQSPLPVPVREATVSQSFLPPTSYKVGTLSLVAILLKFSQKVTERLNNFKLYCPLV